MMLHITLTTLTSSFSRINQFVSIMLIFRDIWTKIWFNFYLKTWRLKDLILAYLDWQTIKICIVVYLSIILNVQFKLYLISSVNPWSINFHFTRIVCLIDNQWYLKQFSHPNINNPNILCGYRFRVEFPNMMSQWTYHIDHNAMQKSGHTWIDDITVESPI